MRMFDAEPEIIHDLLDECEITAAKEHPAFKVSAARHPTLGKLVIVEGKNGDGIVVESDE